MFGGSSRLGEEKSMALSLMEKVTSLFQIVFRTYYKYCNFNLSTRPPTSMTGAMGSELGRITFVFETLCSADCVLYFMVVSERVVFKGGFLSLAFSFKCEFIHASWDKNPIFLPIIKAFQKHLKMLEEVTKNCAMKPTKKALIPRGEDCVWGPG